MRMRRKLALALAGAAVLAGAQFVSAGSALAVPGATLQTATVSFTANPSSGTTGTVQAACPAGTVVLGGGASVVPAVGRAMLTKMQPVQDANGGRFVAEAKSDPGGGTNSLTAYAVCANSLPGLQIISRAGAVTSFPATITGVDCPAGKQAIGGGAAVNGGNGHVTLTAEDEIDRVTQNGTLAEAAADSTGLAGSFSLTDFAVCANPVPGFKIIGGSTNNANAVKLASASCPVGTTVLSVGTEVDANVNGDERLSEAAISGDRRSVRATAVQRPGGTSPGNWGLQVFAVCAS